jgi:hypothetical protein
VEETGQEAEEENDTNEGVGDGMPGERLGEVSNAAHLGSLFPFLWFLSALSACSLF